MYIPSIKFSEKAATELVDTLNSTPDACGWTYEVGSMYDALTGELVHMVAIHDENGFREYLT